MVSIAKYHYTIEYEGSDLIKVRLLADQQKNDAEELKRDIIEIAKRIPGKVNGLLDIGGSTTVDAESGAIYMGIARMELWKKIAVFGGTPLGQSTAQFIVGAIGLDNVKLFSDEDQALAWLQQ